jgi:hypothetical protein
LKAIPVFSIGNLTNNLFSGLCLSRQAITQKKTEQTGIKNDFIKTV